VAAPSRTASILYWTVTVLLVGFGYVGLFSVGAPFLLTGLAMLIIGRWRDRARVLWPALIGVWSFVLGYVLVAPLACTSAGGAPSVRGAASPPAVGHTTCTNILGIDYSGGGGYNPSLFPALVAGLLAAAIGAVLARHAIERRRHDARGDTDLG
jgi:hypothetical protein